MQINHPNTWAETFIGGFHRKNPSLFRTGLVATTWTHLVFDLCRASLVLRFGCQLSKKKSHRPLKHAPNILKSEDQRILFINRWLRVCGMFLGLVGNFLRSLDAKFYVCKKLKLWRTRFLRSSWVDLPCSTSTTYVFTYSVQFGVPAVLHAFGLTVG